jgi:hypothetical protein
VVTSGVLRGLETAIAVGHVPAAFPRLVRGMDRLHTGSVPSEQARADDHEA